MSLAHLRDGPLTERKLARAASLTKRAARLRALNQITQSITQHCGLPPALNTDFDVIPSPPRTPSEDALLDAADLTKCRYFQDSLFPISLDAIEHNPAIKALDTRVTPAPTGLGIIDGPTDAPVSEHADKKATTDLAVTAKSSKESAESNTGTARLPKDAAPTHPPSVELHETPRHRPRTVHLPPKEVQEERLREKQQRQEARRRDAAEHEKTVTETVSSPSTVDAASTATPLPAGPSPMTSTDEDAVAATHLATKTEGPQATSEELSAKQQHDSLLQSQKDIAYREALGHDDDSPDVQLRLEQEQAAKATRDATATANHTASVLPSVDINTATSATTGIELSAPVTGLTEPHSATSDEDTSSDAVSKKRAARPSLVNIMPPRDPALAVAVVDPMEQDSPVQTTTRRASGAIGRKSTSEMTNEPLRTSSQKRASVVEETSKSKNEQIVKRQRPIQEKPQSPASKRYSELLKNEGYTALKGAAEDPNKDYLEPLFRIQINEPPNGRPLHELLQKASKVVTTSDQFAGIHEKQDQRILRRIYQLQNANRWSLRQMEPCAEPAAPKTHMDHLLAEMKWMRTDFRQERKMKKATAKYVAEQCADWVKGDLDVRQSMQVKVKPLEYLRLDTVVPHSPADTNVENGDRQSQGAKSPPGLDNDGESSVDEFDMPRTPQYATIVPSSFFAAINMDKETFHLQDNETFHSALAELPLLTPFEDEESSLQPTIRRPTPAVSKFCDIKMMTSVTGPPKKRSRFDYEDEDDSMDDLALPASKRPRASQENSGLQPEQTDVALFEPENKLLRARLHANTAFRPPSEFQMPSSQFYEFRTASQWTEEDQQTLRRLAKEYSFNWSLIADQLSLPSKFTSATDRRTPWECFERWVELESLPNEMRKTLYFKTWNQRLEAANRNNDARYQAQLAQQAQTPGQPQTVMRRKTLPFRVDKRRQNRYLHTVDAMRKLARKREQQAHKQAEAQKAAHMRKQHENAAPKNGIPTPQEFSRMRQDRDVQIAARQERYREQVLAQQRAAQLQRNGQYPTQQGHPGVGPNRAGPNMPHAQNSQLLPGVSQGVNHQIPQNAQHANATAAQRNGHLAVPQMGMQASIPQAQMQPNMRPGTNGQSHGAPDNMQQRVLDAQRAAHMKTSGQQYQMAPPNRVSPGGMHAPNGVMGSQSNQPMMNGMQNPSNRTPMQQAQPHQSGSNGNAAASPHMPPPPTPVGQSQQPQQLSSGHVPAVSRITHQLQSQHPQASHEKIDEMTGDHMRQLLALREQQQQQSHQHARQSALSAAAGSHAANPVPNGSPAYNQNQTFQQNNVTNGQHAAYNSSNNNTPANGGNPSSQQYSAIMRQRLLAQQTQLQQQSPGPSGQTNGSPRIAQASPVPSMAAPSPNMTPALSQQQSLPPNVSSRTPTPQMVRMGSSQGVAPASATPQPPSQQHTPSNIQHQSPGTQQSSPRPISAGAARS